MVARAAQTIVVLGCTFLLFQFVSLYFTWERQTLLGALLFAIVVAINRFGRGSKVGTLAIVLLSMAATLRYAWWRVHLVVNYFGDESNAWFSLDAFLMLVLLSAEAYTVVIMVLGFMQTSFSLERKPVPMPADESLWPHVDVLIPTYNEPLSLVRYTALAAIHMDYPPDKLHVYILDDGTRDDFRDFAAAAGVGYVVREKHTHAKAGNINHALETMGSPLVAIFDCDHVPTRSFLQCTVGWFLVEQKLAMLQTPHFFYSPDPFERNLAQYKSVPNEGELFYGIIQDGNDLWNATFFCGSCAVLRRKALDEVGGIATETVTEDAHTSLRMQKHGWNTAYINVAQAAGLATETLSAHVGQRVRWARGMIQILRTDNPLLASGMRWSQRLCYFNAMMHFLYAVPRLIFLVSPLAYMLCGRTIIPGYWVAILAYSLPHLLLAAMANSRIQGRHRHSFWNEIYETVLAPHILLPTLLALINPKLGKFNVTDKGTTLEQTKYDRRIAAPATWLLLLNLAGVLVTPYRLFVSDPGHPGVVLSNLCWILFNMVILGVACAVAHEQKQRRTSVRIPAKIQMAVELFDGRLIEGVTSDISVGGASVHFAEPLPFSKGDRVSIAFPRQTGERRIVCTVLGCQQTRLKLHFVNLSLPEEETLTRALYSRADSWLQVRKRMDEDRPLRSLLLVIRLSFTGFRQVALGLLPRETVRRSGRASNRLLARFASVLLLGACAAAMHGQRVQDAPVIELPTGVNRAGEHRTSIAFKDLGVAAAVEMRGPHSFYSLHLTLPLTEMPKRATLQMSYHFSNMLWPHSGHAVLRLNNTPLADLQAPEPAQADGQFAVTSIAVPAELLIRENELTVEFDGEAQSSSRDGNSPVLLQVGASSTVEIVSDALPFRNDLSLLPLPIFDPALQAPANVPFVFLKPPDAGTLQAAGIVASWLGILASAKPVRFSVAVGAIPEGNCVVFANRGDVLPASLHTPAGASVQLAVNPQDSAGTLLVLSGENDEQLLMAARTLAMVKNKNRDDGVPILAEGTLWQIKRFTMPAPREADDAPRWLPSDRQVSLANYSPQPTMQGDGSKPLPVYFRVAPDTFYGEMENLPLRVNYRYNAGVLAGGSALRMFVNGKLINEAPLPASAGVAAGRREALLPVASMRPFANTVEFHFDFAARHGINAALAGAILRSSSIDLRGTDHYAAMPNLELFANAGFPFTQFADLRRTTVILPDAPSPAEVALYLHLMSHFGRQTGFPALRVDVGGPDDITQNDRDYLVLGAVAHQPAFAAMKAHLPVWFDAHGVSVTRQRTPWTRLQAWWQRLWEGDAVPELPRNGDGPFSAMIEGVESPLAAGRSVVVVALRDDASAEGFADAFLERSQSSEIAHTASLLRADGFVSYAADARGYHLGTISRYAVMRIWLTEHFALLLLAVAAASMLLALGVRDMLVRKAAERLRLPQDERGLIYVAL